MLRRLDDLRPALIAPLAALARGEGYHFVDRLIDEWQTGVAKFDGPGDVLMGGFSGTAIVAIGGLHRDPYRGDARTGRLRRVYVAPAARSDGLGRALVEELIAQGAAHFDIVRLRVPDARAARFYEALGFSPATDPDATHQRDMRSAAFGG